MKKHSIGSTGLAVTHIGFGAAALGAMPDTYGYDVDEAVAHETVRSILGSPVNLLDTSRNYGFGRSEKRIGAVIGERGGIPDGFVLATKLDRDVETGRFDAARARRSFEESLAALGVDRVQILHLHDPEYAGDLAEVTHPGGALDELFRIKEEGMATAVGLAMGRLDVMLPLVMERPFDIVLNHNRFTLLNRSANALFDYAAANGIAVFNAAPFAGGVLAKGSSQVSRITYQEVEERSLEPVRRIEALCAKHSVAPGALALQFSLRDPRITSTIVGVSRPERINQTLAWAQAAIPEEAWTDIIELGYSEEDPEADRAYVPG